MTVRALDESGKPVDWWFMYKVPMLGAGANTDSATGYEYVYYDSALDQKNGKVAPSPYTIDSGKGALNQTLDSVFKAPKKSTGYILYNDEAPDSAKIRDDGNLGHTKSRYCLRYDEQDSLLVASFVAEVLRSDREERPDAEIRADLPVSLFGHRERAQARRADGNPSGATDVFEPHRQRGER